MESWYYTKKVPKERERKEKEDGQIAERIRKWNWSSKRMMLQLMLVLTPSSAGRIYFAAEMNTIWLIQDNINNDDNKWIVVEEEQGIWLKLNKKCDAISSNVIIIGKFLSFDVLLWRVCTNF